GDEEDKSQAAGSEAERRGLKRQRDEKDEHGRAYYEFREEAYNSRSKSPPPPEEEPREGEEDETLVILDTYTSDLQFRASRDRYGGQPLFPEKFPGLWAGARSTHGVTKGRVCFEAKKNEDENLQKGTIWEKWGKNLKKIKEEQLGKMGEVWRIQGEQFRKMRENVGGKKIMETDVVELSFSKNGEGLGAAFRIPKDSLAERALLPHVLCKGCAVELNFGQRPEPFGAVPEGFVFIHALPAEERVRTPLPPRSTQECEVLLMVGLPGSGKTQWAQKHSQENREKRYNILGTEAVLHQLRTRGPDVEELDAKSRDLLTQQAAQCLSKLVQIAPRSKRNFILDQCNVYNSGQRRKLLAFKGFSRKVVVIVPTEEDWKKRLELRKEAEGEDVPESVMLEMKANYSLPEKSDYLDEVVYGELGKEEAQPLVARYKEEARKLLPPSEKRANRRNNRNKRNRQNRNRGQGYVGGQRRGYDNRVYGQQQYWGQPGNRG
ncbi:HNRL2 protein, partial [Onychorhynchus coronatus]|nr:HNRL2 protein [Onychorhynchus coronatus]